VRSDYGSLSDGDLATLAVAGTDAAYAEIVRRHRSPVYRLILGNVSDADEALDLTQETFLSAHRALRRYDPARPMRSWLAAIALNKCRDWGRRRTVRRFFTFARDIDDMAMAVPDDRPDQERMAGDRQALARSSRVAPRAACPARDRGHEPGRNRFGAADHRKGGRDAPPPCPHQAGRSAGALIRRIREGWPPLPRIGWKAQLPAQGR